MLTISLVTLGDPGRMTGGYLYHVQVAEAAPAHDARIRFVSFPDRPFPLPALHARRVAGQAARADVVLLDSIAAAFLAPWLARHPCVTPLVAILHQPPGGIDHGPLRTRVQARLDRFAYHRAVRLLAASQALADHLLAQGFPRERVDVVAPGRDVAPVRATGEDLRAGRRVALLCVGNWVARKGILELVDAFARLDEQAATLHLVGDPDADAGYGARVRARLQRPDVSGRVRVHGPVSRERVGQLYAAADLFALASTVEPYGTVYGEAMAAGLPVVGWDAGNLRHLAEDGRHGLLAAPGDVAGLAAALARLADSPQERARMGQAARKRAETFPTWEESCARLFAVLRAVAASRVT